MTGSRDDEGQRAGKQAGRRSSFASRGGGLGCGGRRRQGENAATRREGRRSSRGEMRRVVQKPATPLLPSTQTTSRTSSLRRWPLLAARFRSSSAPLRRRRRFTRPRRPRRLASSFGKRPRRPSHCRQRARRSPYQTARFIPTPSSSNSSSQEASPPVRRPLRLVRRVS